MQFQHKLAVTAVLVLRTRPQFIKQRNRIHAPETVAVRADYFKIDPDGLSVLREDGSVTVNCDVRLGVYKPTINIAFISSPSWNGIFVMI